MIHLRTYSLKISLLPRQIGSVLAFYHGAARAGLTFRGEKKTLFVGWKPFVFVDLQKALGALSPLRMK